MYVLLFKKFCLSKIEFCRSSPWLGNSWWEDMKSWHFSLVDISKLMKKTRVPRLPGVENDFRPTSMLPTGRLLSFLAKVSEPILLAARWMPLCLSIMNYISLLLYHAVAYGMFCKRAKCSDQIPLNFLNLRWEKKNALYIRNNNF